MSTSATKKMVVISHSLYRNLMKNRRRYGYGKTVRGDKVYHNIEKDNEGLDKMRRKRPPRSYSKYNGSSKSDDDEEDNDDDDNDDAMSSWKGLYGDDARLWDQDDEMEDEPQGGPEGAPESGPGRSEGEVKTEPIDVVHLPAPDDSSTEPYRDGFDTDDLSLSRTPTSTPKTPKTTPRTGRGINVALTPKNSESSLTRKSIDKLTPTINWVTSIDDVNGKTPEAGPSGIQVFTPENPPESLPPSSPARPSKKSRSVAKVPPSERKKQLSRKAKEKK